MNAVTNPQVSVRPGERIRLRLINASNARVYAPRFGPLDARLVAVDGGSVRDPSEADGFVLAPGNRIDVDVTVPANATGRLPVVDDFTGEILELATLVAEHFAAGDRVTISATFANAEGDIDMVLLDPDGRVVAASTSVTDNEQIALTIASSGTYAIRVYLYSDAGTPGARYSLTVGIVGATPTCRDDGLEALGELRYRAV